MQDITVNAKTGTCTNTSTTNTTLRSTLNAGATYRGTTYLYPQRVVIGLLAQAFAELGFNVRAENSTNYQNHIVFSDLSEDVCLQLYHSGASAANIGLLYPRHVMTLMSIGAIFNTNTSCYASLRMVGEGAGKTKTMVLFSGSAAPTLTSNYGIYFTEAKYLPTGEMKKAIIIMYSSNYHCYFYEDDWSFLPGFKSDLTTAATMNSYCCNLSLSNGYRHYVDPYTSYKMFQEQSNFPEFPAITTNGLWEFPDIIQFPYGFVKETDTTETLKYTLAAGNIYQIGNKKYLCNYASTSNFMFRVE